MKLSYMKSVCDGVKALSPGAQTERRGDAAPSPFFSPLRGAEGWVRG
jgi:hypothetical protein